MKTRNNIVTTIVDKKDIKKNSKLLADKTISALKSYIQNNYHESLNIEFDYLTKSSICQLAC